jgi:hypothetical protein
MLPRAVTDLHALLAEKAAIDRIASFLDALDAQERERQANDLSGREQRLLWEIAGDAPRLTAEHFVPRELAELVPVHHPGRNTIPVPPYFQRFEKRFCRPRGERSRVFGYNSSNASFVHPGYFVGYSTAGHEGWEGRGGFVIDYWMVPDEDVPDSWPKVVPNSVGLQKLVYHRTRDFMRRVSSHVSIGRASREDESGDVELDFWFTLCRQEPSLR